MHDCSPKVCDRIFLSMQFECLSYAVNVCENKKCVRCILTELWPKFSSGYDHVFKHDRSPKVCARQILNMQFKSLLGVINVCENKKLVWTTVLKILEKFKIGLESRLRFFLFCLNYWTHKSGQAGAGSAELVCSFCGISFKKYCTIQKLLAYQ